MNSRRSALHLLSGVLVSLLSCVLLAPSAIASPWTLPQHELVISSDLSFSFATQEYLYEDSKLQDYSVNGNFRSTNLALSFRYGFTDRFEMEVRPNFKQLSYDADPVILSLPALGDQSAMNAEGIRLADARRQVIDFDSSRFGAADMNLAARYNLYRGVVVVTPEVGAKIPLGYEPPAGTFSAANRTGVDQSVFAVSDDATLGDGQLDVHAALLLGTYIPYTKSFIRAEGGFIHRFGAPGDQAFANAKVGQYALDNLIFFGGVRWTKTVIQGDPIGDTYVDLDPSQTALNFDFANVEVRDLYLDRDFTVVEFGMIVDLDTVEMQIAVEEVVDGRNFADLTSFNVGIVTSFPDATRPDAPKIKKSEEPTEVIEEVILVPEGASVKPKEGEEGTEVIEEVIVEEVPVEPKKKTKEAPKEKPESPPKAPETAP